MSVRRPLRSVLVALASAALLLSGCSAEEPGDVARDQPDTTVSPSVTTSPSPSAPSGDVLAGTWSTPPITMARIRHVAQQAGFAEKDVDELMAAFGDTRQVVYTIELRDGFWVTFETRDSDAAADAWSGPYEVLDDATVRAGQPPCGPITYTYRLDGDELSLDMTEDECIEGGVVAPVGELLAQTTIYESAPFARIG